MENTVQVTFRDGKKGAFIGSHEKKIVIAGSEHKGIVEGVAYDCVLIPMKKGNGFIVASMTKTTPIIASLYFKDGNKDLMVSSFKEKIVLMPEHIEKKLEIIPGVEYRCEFVLANSGKAYIVQQAAALPPSPAEVIYEGYPVFVVNVKINGVTDYDLEFDCVDVADIAEKVMKDKMHYIKKRNLLEKENIVKEYEQVCKRAIGEFNARKYSRNASRV